MAASLGLTLWNLRRRATDAGAPPSRPPAPKAPLAWLHVPGQASADGMLELARRLREKEGLAVLVTSPLALPASPGVIVQPPPGERPEEARDFLDYWKPRIGVLAEGELRPVLINEAELAGLPMILLDGRKPELTKLREGWFPGLVRSALSALAHVQALDETAARAFRRAGLPAIRLEVTGRMEQPSAALPCLEAEREVLADQLATRPVWFAASVPVAEEAAVLAAHRAAVGLAHRLLLILQPEDPARAQPLAAELEEKGWVVALRSAEQEPERDIEIYVVEGEAELGLWYRLAPLSFLGGSLSGTGAIRSPMEPAALGSAILHGPRPGAHGAALGRLGAARAARAVASPADLSEALSDLLAPDRAARLAQSAWNIATEGAEVTEAALARIRSLIAAGTPA